MDFRGNWVNSLIIIRELDWFVPWEIVFLLIEVLVFLFLVKGEVFSTVFFPTCTGVPSSFFSIGDDFSSFLFLLVLVLADFSTLLAQNSFKNASQVTPFSSSLFLTRIVISP